MHRVFAGLWGDTHPWCKGTTRSTHTDIYRPLEPSRAYPTTTIILQGVFRAAQEQILCVHGTRSVFSDDSFLRVRRSVNRVSCCCRANTIIMPTDASCYPPARPDTFTLFPFYHTLVLRYAFVRGCGGTMLWTNETHNNTIGEENPAGGRTDLPAQIQDARR